MLSGACDVLARTTRLSDKFAELEPPIQIRVTAGGPHLRFQIAWASPEAAQQG